LLNCSQYNVSGSNRSWKKLILFVNLVVKKSKSLPQYKYGGTWKANDTKTFSVPLYFKSIIQLYHTFLKLNYIEILKLFLLLFVIQTQAQQGGMWIPSY
jgi:hypothetical protein